MNIKKIRGGKILIYGLEEEFRVLHKREYKNP